MIQEVIPWTWHSLTCVIWPNQFGSLVSNLKLDATLSILKAQSYLPCILHGQCNQPGSSLAGTAPGLRAGLLTRPCTPPPYIVSASAPEVNSQHVDQSRFPRSPTAASLRAFHHTRALAARLFVGPLELCDLVVPSSLLPSHFPGPSVHRTDPFTRAQHVFFLLTPSTGALPSVRDALSLIFTSLAASLLQTLA